MKNAKNGPLKFQELLKRHRARFEKRLQYLKENDPQTYEKIMRRREEHRRHWAEHDKNGFDQREAAYGRVIEKRDEMLERVSKTPANPTAIERHERNIERFKQKQAPVHPHRGER